MKDKIFNYISDNIIFAYDNLSLDEFKDLLISVLKLCLNQVQFLFTHN